MLRNLFYLSLISIAVISCGTSDTSPESTTKTEQQTANHTSDSAGTTSKADSLPENVEVYNGMYTEYYPDTKRIKFQGPQDENKQRHGLWYYYGSDGKQLSMTEYRNGKRNGISWVKYPNGSMNYSGEYANDIKVGTWKTYDQSGKLVEEKNYSK